MVGINFSGYWFGPKLLQQLVMMAGILKVLIYDFIKRSPLAFEAA